MKWQLGLGRENGLAFWGLLFIEGSFGAFFPVWPLYMEELGAPIALVGLLLGLGGVFRLFALLPTVTLSRRLGSKRLLLGCRLVFSVAIGMAAFVPSWEWLLPVLIGSAIGSMAFPIILSHVSANADDETRVRAFSVVVTIGPSVALFVAPLLSSLLIALFGLRAPFLLSGFLSLISVAILSRISEAKGEEPGDEGSIEAGYRAAVANKPVRNLLVLKLFTVFALGLGVQLIPNYLRETGGYSDDMISLLTSFSALGTIAFGALVVRNQRFSNAPLLGAALAVVLVSAGYLLFLLPEIAVFVVIAFLFRGGMFASIALFSAALGNMAAPRNREHIFTLSEIAIVVGFSTAPIVAGLLYEVTPSLPLVVSAALGAPIAVLLLRLRAERRSGPEPGIASAGPGME